MATTYWPYNKAERGEPALHLYTGSANKFGLATEITADKPPCSH